MIGSRTAAAVSVCSLAAVGVCSLMVIGCGGQGGPAALDDPPTLLAPFQAQATGSIWSTRAAPSALRPQFRWTEVAGATQYEVQVDDSCDSPRKCEFPSPEVDDVVDGTSFVVSSNLPVSMAPPVGRRYYWRVRACWSGKCRAWSVTQYVDVARQRQDFNGDGYADLAVAAAGSQENAALVYFGGPQLPTAPSWIVRGGTLAQEPFAFGKVLWAGDVNGDGFADLVAIVDRAGGSAVRVYLGGTAPANDSAIEIADPEASRTAALAVMAGDMNGDGFADVAQNWLVTLDQGTYVVSFGGNLTLTGSSQASISHAPGIAAACDFNADGFADLVESWNGIHIFKGGTAGPLGDPAPLSVPAPTGVEAIACVWNVDGKARPSLLLLDRSSNSLTPLQLASSDLPSTAPACGGALPALSTAIDGLSGAPSAGVGDVDGDGFDDILVGDPSNNRAALFFGGCPVDRVIELQGTTDRDATAQSGYAVAGLGDVDGDGFPDFAIANPYAGVDTFCAGEISVFAGGPAVGAAPMATLQYPHEAPPPSRCATSDGFGASID